MPLCKKDLNTYRFCSSWEFSRINSPWILRNPSIWICLHMAALPMCLSLQMELSFLRILVQIFIVCLPVIIIGHISNSWLSNLNLISLSKTLFPNKFAFTNMCCRHKYTLPGDTVQPTVPSILYTALLSWYWWWLSEFTSWRNPQTMGPGKQFFVSTWPSVSDPLAFSSLES